MQPLTRAKEKELRALESRHGRKKAGLIAVEGVRALGTLLDSGRFPAYVLVSPDHFSATGAEFVERLKSSQSQLFECPAELFAELADTEHSQGFLAAVERGELGRGSEQAIAQAPLLVYLDGVADPGNLGTIIRTCAAFGVGLLAVSPTSADFDNPKVLRAAAGNMFALPLLRVADIDTFFRELESNQIELLAAASEATVELGRLQFGKRVCILLGAESTGLSEQIRRRQPTLFRIRTTATVESLNVASAAAIAISQISERMKLI